MTMPIKPLGISHYAIKVTDLQRSVHFYHDVLGMPLSRPLAEGARSAVVEAGPQRIDIFYREDFVEADKENPVGVDHVCFSFEADSEESVIDYLKQQGIEVMWGPVHRFGTSVYVYDPDGIHVELHLKLPPEKEHPDARRRPEFAVAG